MDVCVDLRHRKTVQSALRNLPSEFRTYAQSGRNKLHFSSMDDDENVNSGTIGSFNYSHVPWAWPFIDILYFRRVGPDTAVEVMWELKKYDLKQIFPVIFRPFGQHWYPAPRNPLTGVAGKEVTRAKRALNRDAFQFTSVASRHFCDPDEIQSMIGKRMAPCVSDP
ncbi:hypothetical protein TSMEX_009476 [Taenia solium]|eukprot:TsM_001032000 transcript=TsM_001032000 gene=TsM_001032000